MTVKWRCAEGFKALDALGYRVVRSPEWAIKPPSRASAAFREKLAEDRLWLLEVPCRKGGKIAGHRAHIYMHGPDTFAYTGKGRRLHRHLMQLAGVRRHQTGDEEFTVLFPRNALAGVAEVVRPAVKRCPKSSIKGGQIDLRNVEAPHA